MRVPDPWYMPTHLPFVKWLESLPNLHTLEMGEFEEFDTPALRRALKGVKLPHIKTLILSPAAYPLLQHCRDVENVTCVVGSHEGPSDKFLKSLAFNRGSKIKRLVVPLVLRADSSSKLLNAIIWSQGGNY